jgi:hypothetical protein
MAESKEAPNQAALLKEFDTLFNKRDTRLRSASGRRAIFNTVPTTSRPARV